MDSMKEVFFMRITKKIALRIIALLLSAVMVTTLFTGCDNAIGAYIITITADTTSIRANGVDKAVLSAVVTDRDGNVIEDAEVEFYEDETLDKLIVYPEYRTKTGGRHYIYATYQGCTSQLLCIRASTVYVNTVELEVNDANARGNNSRTLDLSATVYNQKYEEQKNQKITYYADGNALEDNDNIALSDGVHIVSAVCEGVASNRVAVLVGADTAYSKQHTLTLKANTTFLLGITEDISLRSTLVDDDGNQIANPDVTYHLATGTEGATIQDDKFTANKAGTYTVYALCNNMISNTLTITAKEPEFINAESTNLPVVVIDTNGQEIHSDGKINATMAVYNDADEVNSITDTPELLTNITIKVRGQSSSTFPKKQYGIELKDALGEDRSYPVLGMSDEEDWILNGSYADKSLMRNYIAYYLGRQSCEWAPNAKFCEVYINDSNDPTNPYNYMGVYLMIEKIKIDDERVDIDKLDVSITGGEAITGGYIVARDKIKDGEASIGTAQGNFSFVSPQYENMNREQIEYINDYMNDFVNALFGDDYKDPYKGYAAYLDLESYATVLAINEFLKSIDGMNISLYYYKPRGEKLHAGPVWDFDLSMGNVDYRTGTDPTGWYCVSLDVYPRRMLQDNDFVVMFRNKWKELRETVFTDENIDAIIDGALEQLQTGGALERSLERWPGQWNGMFVWPNPSYGDERYTATYEAEVDYLRYFLHERAAWLDKNIDGTIDLEPVYYDWINEYTGERMP